MNTKILLVISLSLLLILGGAPKAFATPAQTPEQAAVQFYKWYIGELNRNRFPREKQKTKLLSYLSKRFGKWVYSIPAGEYGADAFIDAQDWDEDWVNAVTASRATIKGNTATLKITLGADQNGRIVVKSKWKHELRLKMVKEGGGWKIDRVNDY